MVMLKAVYLFRCHLNYSISCLLAPRQNGAFYHCSCSITAKDTIEFAGKYCIELFAWSFLQQQLKGVLMHFLFLLVGNPIHAACT